MRRTRIPSFLLAMQMTPAMLALLVMPFLAGCTDRVAEDSLTQAGNLMDGASRAAKSPAGNPTTDAGAWPACGNDRGTCPQDYCCEGTCSVGCESLNCPAKRRNEFEFRLSGAVRRTDQNKVTFDQLVNQFRRGGRLQIERPPIGTCVELQLCRGFGQWDEWYHHNPDYFVFDGGTVSVAGLPAKVLTQPESTAFDFDSPFSVSVAGRNGVGSFEIKGRTISSPIDLLYGTGYQMAHHELTVLWNAGKTDEYVLIDLGLPGLGLAAGGPQHQVRCAAKDTGEFTIPKNFVAKVSLPGLASNPNALLRLTRVREYRTRTPGLDEVVLRSQVESEKVVTFWDELK